MKKLLVALFALPFTAGLAAAQAPDINAGKTLWDVELRCKDCHGGGAEGAFGPDLAGRGLSHAQVLKAVREPWGIMPTFTKEQVSDQELANITAWFASMQKPAQPGPWKTPVPANAPEGQRVMITAGCGQCHGAVLIGPRDDMGAFNADINWLKDLVYNHTTSIRTMAQQLGTGNGPERVHMGNFNRDRITEAQLASILNWVKTDVGFRAPMRGRLTKGTAGEKGVTYNLNVVNTGIPGKGLTAETVTVRLVLPQGATVVNATGAGYKGARMDETQKAQVAEWTWAKAGPKEKQDYTITVSKAGTREDNVRGMILWAKPTINPGNTGDQIAIPGAPL